MKRDPQLSEKIAAATLSLLEEGGEERVTMRRVASAVGITPMAIYHHFSSREALLRAVTDAEFEKLSTFFKAKRVRATPDSALISFMEGYVDYAFAHPRIFDYVFSKYRADARQFPGDLHARHSPTMNVTADAVDSGMKSGVLKKDDVWEVALALWAHVHGYVMLYHGGRFDLTEKKFRDLCRRSVRRLFNGLKA